MKEPIPFRKYDVLGVYPHQIDYPKAIAVGHAFAKVMGPGTVYVGRDNRPGSGKLVGGLLNGLEAGGAHVEFLSLCTTDMVIYALGAHHAEAGIMVSGCDTHEGFNGFQFFGPDCQPVPPAVIDQIREEASKGLHVDTEGPEAEPLPTASDVVDYREFMGRVLEGYGEIPPTGEPFRVLLDGGVGLGAATLRHVATRIGLPKGISLIDVTEYDGAPPRGTSTCDPDRWERMADAIKGLEADLGFIWSSDGNTLRVFGADAQPIEPAHVGGYMAAIHAQRFEQDALITDHRAAFPMMRTAKEFGTPFAVSQPDPPAMMQAMRQANATFGASVTGEYYFRELWWSGSSTLAAALFLHAAYVSPEPVHITLGKMAYLCPVHGPEPLKVADPVVALQRLSNAFSASTGLSIQQELLDTALVMRSLDPLADWRMVVEIDTLLPNTLYITLEGQGGVDMVLLTGIAMAVHDHLYETEGSA